MDLRSSGCQALSRRRGRVAPRGNNLFRLIHHQGRAVEQLLIPGMQNLLRRIASSSRSGNQPLHHAPHTARPIAKDGRLDRLDVTRDLLSPLDDTIEHADTIAEQDAVDGIADMDFDPRAIHPQLTPPCHLQLAREVNDMIQRLVECDRLNHVRPAENGCVVGQALQIDAAELAQHQTVADPWFGLRVTPAIQLRDDEQAQDDFNWRGRASVEVRAGKAVRTVPSR